MTDLKYLLSVILISPLVKVAEVVSERDVSLSDYAITTVVVAMLVSLWVALKD
jgi:hypothetical protein